MGQITFENVVRRFGELEVIRNVSLEIPDGQFTVIVGPSGSGKTTMLRAIAGLEKVDEGRIYIDGRDVTELPPKERDIAFVFQNYALYGHLTVAQNLGFPLKAQKVPKPEIEQRVAAVAKRLGLEHLLKRKPKQLSGGQQQRVAIGRAIIREPKVYLFDEPLSNLDTQLRLEMRREIIQLHSDLGVTSVWVTHDQEEAMAMGDRILVVNEGRIEQEASPDMLFSRPANTYVATTIGSPPMNMLTGRSTGDSFDGPLKLSFEQKIPAGEVIIGIRPEDIELVEPGSDVRGVGQFEAEVGIVERLGARGIVTLHVNGHQLTAVFPRRTISRIEEGARLTFTADRNSIHVFDAETEQRLTEADLETAKVPTAFKSTTIESEGSN